MPYTPSYMRPYLRLYKPYIYEVLCGKNYFYKAFRVYIKPYLSEAYSASLKATGHHPTPATPATPTPISPHIRPYLSEAYSASFKATYVSEALV